MIVQLDSPLEEISIDLPPVVIWTEQRQEPRPLATSYMRVDLHSSLIDLFVMVGDDPDGDGPAEATLTMPVDLMNQGDALAAVNANAFSKVHPEDRFLPWSEGMHVNMIGMAVSDGQFCSPLDNPRYSNSQVAFWINALRVPQISRPAESVDVRQAVGDFCAVLIQDGQLIPEEGGPRHPRTALGFDESDRFLLLVVVDGRRDGYSDGMTMHELARLLQDHGCRHAINLDGGGSSIMLHREQKSEVPVTVNRPSSDVHRPIPAMIGVRRRERL
ncbi:phosphodiester glycosidase family protein [Rubinisphaera margarita]|uniref:phosphodiester glycosidase family protein n=1 Tax=Rubinisphaera margarita TaxID=2909586 RepID=UPI001EE8D37C|nr:phosphodiester glycosidase family protein [Rubinisphaera margarita]MCG6158211.1 phosphodiester glycosidase family protein [Rubinisphaera margarita]